MKQVGWNKFLALAGLLCWAVAAQAQPDGLKRWSEEAPLLWSDFKGLPDAADTPYAAITYAGLDLDVSEVSFSGLVTFKVRAVFDCRRSWAHPARKDAAVLAHEQLHFDIAEIFARRLERKLSYLQLRVRDKAKAKQLLAQYQRAQLKEQARFDRESMHGLNRAYEAAWRQKADIELRIRRDAPKLVRQK